MVIKVFRGKAQSFKIKNPILDNGDIAYEIDTHKIKVGDGNREYNKIPYSTDSAYEAWLSLGNSGTVEDFLESLKGEDGKDGVGKDGKSAYELWLENGNIGTENDFINSLSGRDGKSAYELWLEDGNTGTESEFSSGLTKAISMSNVISDMEARITYLEENGGSGEGFEIASDSDIDNLLNDI